jgi:hypothetical protein
MIICDKYKLIKVRGFALAFDIAIQNYKNPIDNNTNQVSIFILT